MPNALQELCTSDVVTTQVSQTEPFKEAVRETSRVLIGKGRLTSVDSIYHVTFLETAS